MSILSIDLGTTNAKAVLFEEETGVVISSGAAGYSMITGQPGQMEQSPSDWWNAVATAIKACLKKSNQGSEKIKVIGLSGLMVSFVPLDKTGKALANAAIGLDSRSLKEVELMKQDPDLIDVGFNEPSIITTAPRLLWFKKNYKELWDKMDVWVHPKDYIRLCLTGVAGTEITDASDTLLLDFFTYKWDKVAEKYGLDINKFPKVSLSQDIVGEVTKLAAEQTGLKAGTPVVAGASDMACSAIGTRAIKEGNVSGTIGTVAHLLAPISKPNKKRIGKLLQFCHAIPGMYYTFGAVPTGGYSFAWLRDVFASCCGDAYDLIEITNRLSGLAADVSVGSDGLFFLPYLTGAQMPLIDPNARGVFLGMGPNHKAGHMAKAVMEGVAYVMRQIVETYKECDVPAEALFLGDGGCKSKTWVRALANILGFKDTYLMNNLDSSPLGAAIIAGMGVGIYEDMETASKKIASYSRIEKDNEAQKAYDKYYETFISIYPALKDVFIHLQACGN